MFHVTFMSNRWAGEGAMCRFNGRHASLASLSGGSIHWHELVNCITLLLTWAADGTSVSVAGLRARLHAATFLEV